MKHSRLAAVLVVVAVVAFAGSAVAGQVQGKVLTSTLEVAKAAFEPSDDLAITFTLTNTTAEQVAVVRWQTPIDGVEGDIFEVTRDGEPVLYTGRLYKWATPTAADYLVIPAGESVSTVVDISAAYDMAQRGQYTVRYRTELQDVLVGESKALASAAVESGAVDMWIEGIERDYAFEEFLEKRKPVKPGGGGTGSFVGCTTTRQNQLLTAKSNALSMCNNAYSDLAGHTYTNLPTLYPWWFGAATSSRYGTVKANFADLAGTFATASFVFDCSTCTMNAYAYVYPSQPYRIYLCRVFWHAPNTGRDSKAGTLVHETSHFNAVAGTNDYVYGATGAHNLALSDPNRAIDNADNHEYFAEDH